MLTALWLGQTQASAAPVVGLEEFSTGNGGYSVENGIGAGVPTGPWVFNAGAETWSTDGGLGVVNSALNTRRLTVVTPGTATMILNHRYNFEDDGTTRWDAGAIRISVNGGAFTLVPSTSLSGENYKTDKTIGGNSPPLFGEFAFNNTSPGYDSGTFVQTTAQLGTFNAGDNFTIQFIGAWDEGTVNGPPNWEITSVEFDPTVEDQGATVLPFFPDPNLPADANVIQGGSHTLTIEVGGDPAPVIQWHKDGLPLSGETGTSLTLTDMAVENAGSYFVRASSVAGSSDSRTATIAFVPDTFGPQLLLAVGDADLVTITLTLDEALETDPLLSASEDSFSYSLSPLPETGPGDDLFFASAQVVDLTNVVLVLSIARDPGTNYRLDLFGGVITDLYGNTIEEPDNSINLASQQTLLALNAVWQYDQSGVDPGLGWLEAGAPAFPNSGPGVLGQETAGDVVPLLMTDLRSPGEGSGTFSYYFRTTFIVSDAASLKSLVINYWVDDAAVIYINGTEVHRTSSGGSVFPGQPGDPVPFGTQPAPAVGDASLTSGVTLAIDSVVSGVNTISVYNGQAGGNSSDVVWGAELIGVVAGVSTDPPEILADPLSQTVDERQNVTLTVQAGGAPPLTYQWRKGGVNLDGETGQALVLNNVTPDANGSYDVIVMNDFGTATSAAATLTVTPDTLAPTVVSTVGDANLTDITITFSEEPTTATAEDTGNYTVTQNAGGGGAGGAGVLVLTAVKSTTNPLVVVLTTEPRLEGLNYDVTISGLLDLAATPNPIAPATVQRISATVLLFTTGHVWSYEESNTALAAPDWTLPAYVDSGWLSGPSVLGFEANQTIATPLQPTFPGQEAQTLTYYFRTHFTFTAEPATAALRALVDYDDGFAMYLNGTRVANNGVPVGAVHTDQSTVGHESGTHEAFNLGNNGLVMGDNVLAVEIHQNGLTSSDAVLDVRLQALLPDQAPPGGPPLFTTQPASQSVDQGADVTFSTTATGTQPITYQWQKDGADIVGETGLTLTLTGVTAADEGTYTVIASNGDPGSPTTSQGATLAVRVVNVLLSVGQAWSYAQNDVAQAADWITPAFIEGAEWSSGPSPLGVEPNLPEIGTSGTPLNLIDPPNTTQTLTYYFRTHFTYSPSLGNALELSLNWDDGFRMYLNGVAILSQNITNETGVPLVHTDTAGSHEADGFETFVIQTALLADGDNVLAVEVHQQSVTSSDIVWDMSMLAFFRAPEVTVTVEANGDVTVSWTPLAGYVLVESDTVDGTYTPVAGNPQGTHTVTAAQVATAGQKFYQLRNP